MINCNTYFRMMPFFCFHISQGSVATRLKRGEIFKREFVANLPSSRLLKKIWKSVNIWWSYGQEFGVLFFLTHGVYWFIVRPFNLFLCTVHSFPPLTSANLRATIFFHHIDGLLSTTAAHEVRRAGVLTCGSCHLEHSARPHPHRGWSCQVPKSGEITLF